MEIRTVSIIGLGALGILFGHHLSKVMPPECLRIIADQDRIKRYKAEQVFCNGEQCRFDYMTPEKAGEPADLLIFTVKYNDLSNAVEMARNQVGEHTLIISLLNGITSETIIGQTYGMDNILYSVAQGMDAVKVGNQMAYKNMGIICIGDLQPEVISPKVNTVADFFDKTGIPYEVDTNMYKRLWGKLMLNVGINQAVAVYEGDYGIIQREGPARATMIAAMREVMALSEKEGINLTEEDLNYWLQLVRTLNPQGKPSLRQDLEAKRRCEVDLFAGTVVQLGQKHGIPTPVNQALYNKIREIESHF